MVCSVLPSFVSSNLHAWSIYVSFIDQILFLVFYVHDLQATESSNVKYEEVRNSLSLLYHNVLFLTFYAIHAWCMDDELIIFLLIFQEFITNSKGVKLFTCRWIPTDCEPKAIVFLNHGYAMECSFSMKGKLPFYNISLLLVKKRL